MNAKKIRIALTAGVLAWAMAACGTPTPGVSRYHDGVSNQGVGTDPAGEDTMEQRGPWPQPTGAARWQN